ncbi:hypothetical protein B0H63DRAFT_50849 [Podospora didyma]|uniref:Uncharacterized protein n=1 Tax=Podospora didyma TaxID=330526 RepID=A0AAE0P763_9PEZI|nr:hypothetical protein B0H63DRAFT_50849 [Podospora didyma]
MSGYAALGDNVRENYYVSGPMARWAPEAQPHHDVTETGPYEPQSQTGPPIPTRRIPEYRATNIPEKLGYGFQRQEYLHRWLFPAQEYPRSAAMGSNFRPGEQYNVDRAFFTPPPSALIQHQTEARQRPMVPGQYLEYPRSHPALQAVEYNPGALQDDQQQLTWHRNGSSYYVGDALTNRDSEVPSSEKMEDYILRIEREAFGSQEQVEHESDFSHIDLAV